jgi:NitT/TauT family transport system permease protein/taurine transport system permease protein
MRTWRRTVIGLATIAVLAGLWYVATDLTELVSAGRLPGPADTWAAFQQVALGEYANGNLLEHVLNSVKLIGLGFLAATAVGVPLGLLMGWSARAEAIINPIFLLIRPIPPLAWIPLAILWLGLGDAAKVLVIWFAAFVPAVINTYTGVRNIEPWIVEAARMLGTPRARFVNEVMVPAALPMIFTGMRLALQASWTTLVAAELVGALYGLGRVLNVAQQDIYPGMIVVGMACVAILGWATTRALAEVERHAMPWMQVRA